MGFLVGVIPFIISVWKTLNLFMLYPTNASTRYLSCTQVHQDEIIEIAGYCDLGSLPGCEFG